jgi:hypothetical protein
MTEIRPGAGTPSPRPSPPRGEGARTAALLNRDGGKCEALLYADGFECERCAFGWDDGETPPTCSPLTLARLKAAAIEEAERIEASQRALIAAGDRKRRYVPAVKRALELRALARLVERVDGDREFKARLHAGKKA